MTFGFREGLSTLDIRQSTNEDLETVRREVYVRRPSSRTSTNSGEETTPPGNSQVFLLEEKTLFVRKTFVSVNLLIFKICFLTRIQKNFESSDFIKRIRNLVYGMY